MSAMPILLSFVMPDMASRSRFRIMDRLGFAGTRSTLNFSILPNNSAINQLFHHPLRKLLGPLIQRLETNFRSLRRLIGGINTGKVLDLAGLRLGVEALWVS